MSDAVIILIGFALVNLISATLFAYDKQAAIHSKFRIPERTLHFLELSGGVFANLLLMYLLKHKNRKFSYWIYTWLISFGWIILLYAFCNSCK